jgi:hypothetical protein
MRLSSMILRIFGGKSASTSAEAISSVQQFLIVFDTKAGKIVEQRLFVDPDEAMSIFGETERRHAREGNLQVLLFTADSLDTVKSTHPHYFSESGPHTDPFGLKPAEAAA